MRSHTSALTELRKGRWWPPPSLFSFTLRQGLSMNRALVFSARLEASEPQQCIPQSCGYSILWQHLTCYIHAEFWILGLTISKQMSLSTEPSFQSLKMTILMTWKMLLILKFLFNYSWPPKFLPSLPFLPMSNLLHSFLLLFLKISHTYLNPNLKLSISVHARI